MQTATEQQFFLRLEFLGFRYHGWQYQPGTLTLEGMLRKTLRFVLPGTRVKMVAASRTDAKVSATDFALQLIIREHEPLTTDWLLKQLNSNLPSDIRVAAISRPAPAFNAIRDSLIKSYGYFFCFGEKPHPFAASLLGFIPGSPDLEAMAAAARLFEGKHNFRGFMAGNTGNKRVFRTIDESRIMPNTELTASFFPKQSYIFKVSGNGFGRSQVRLMMAALADIGRGTEESETLLSVLKTGSDWPGASIAPASGLQLLQSTFKTETNPPTPNLR